MGKKTLYIRLDSSPLPKENDKIILKDFNLDSYFCTLLGKKLLENVKSVGTIAYPGKLIADFEKSDKEGYKEIIQQWQQILINLLNVIHIQNQEYKINLPLSYANWLSNNFNDVYRQLSLNYNKLEVQISKEFVYNEIIKNVLVRKIYFLLTKIGSDIQRIIFSANVFIQNSTFMEDVNKCTGYHIREKFKINFFPYEDCLSYSEGLAAVCKMGKWGFIDKEGNEIIPQVYKTVDCFSEGLAAVCKKDKWGYIDKEGNEIIPCIYDKVGYFSQGLAMVRKHEEYNVIDKYGNEIIPTTYTLAYHVSHHTISEGFVAVQNVKNNQYGFVDCTGKEVIPCIYDMADSFSEGLAMVLINNKYGFIDRNGKEVIPCIYDMADSFSEGLAMVQKNNKYGFIDRNGKEVIPCIYDMVHSFSGGLAMVQKNNKYGFIDKNGKEVIPCVYGEKCIGNRLEGKFVWVKENGKYGFMNHDGKVIIPCIYDYASGFCSEWAYFYRKRNLIEKGLVNEKGEEFIFINSPQHCYETMILIREGEYLSTDCRYNFIPTKWLKDL